MENNSKSFKLSKGAKTAIILIVGYFVIDAFIRAEQKKKEQDNAANDPETTFAIRLYAAFHPVVDWEWFPDGTDEDEVKAVAIAMKRYKNYNEVSKKYRTLYSRELTSDLTSEGVYNLFFQNYN